MNTEQEDFQSLRRLIVLKRHEQPPPGYFNGFSRQVIAGIKAGERHRFSEAPWYRRFWAALDARPALAGAFGAAVCTLFIGGMLFSEGVGTSPAGAGLAVSTPPVGLRPIVSRADSVLPPHGLSEIPVASATGMLPQPVSQPLPGGSLFDQVPLPQTKAVDWTVPNRN